uniref:uncharacterized protein LOC122597546 n=1 Tax=Erigeron canadensis TaxID=72917 RepID=UPI001CB8C93C|nr:uncharacterized protein LOC122597546 [Erigeron canadensis]
MVTILFVLQAEDDSGLLGYMLLGSKNIPHLLPPKFVYCLLKNRKDHNLNLTPEVVAEAFLSIDDPLVIVSSKDKNPRIDAPCAIFVDLRKSKEKIINILFTKKTMPCDNKILQNFAINISSKTGKIPKDLLSLASNTCSEANPNVMNSVSESSNATGAHQVKNHVKDIGDEPSDGGGKTQDVKNKKGRDKRNRKKGTRNGHSGQTSSNNVNGETISVKPLEFEPHCLKSIAEFINENKGESLSSSSAIALIKKKNEMNLHSWAEFIEDLKPRVGEDAKLREDLMLWEMYYAEVNLSIVTEKDLQLMVKKLQENGLIELSPTTQDSKAVSGSSSTTEFKETQRDEKMNHAEETCDGSAVEVVLENQSGGGNSEDAQKSKKGKGKKGKEK